MEYILISTSRTIQVFLPFHLNRLRVKHAPSNETFNSRCQALNRVGRTSSSQWNECSWKMMPIRCVNVKFRFTVGGIISSRLTRKQRNSGCVHSDFKICFNLIIVWVVGQSAKTNKNPYSSVPLNTDKQNLPTLAAGCGLFGHHFSFSQTHSLSHSSDLNCQIAKCQPNEMANWMFELLTDDRIELSAIVSMLNHIYKDNDNKFNPISFVFAWRKQCETVSHQK